MSELRMFEQTNFHTLRTKSWKKLKIYKNLEIWVFEISWNLEILHVFKFFYNIET